MLVRVEAACSTPTLAGHSFFFGGGGGERGERRRHRDCV